MSKGQREPFLQQLDRENQEASDEGDRNGEVASVVDGLFAIARALDRVADAVRDAPDRGFSTYHGMG